MAQRLTAFSRILIILAIVAGVYFLLQKFVLNQDTTNANVGEDTITLEDATNEAKTTSSTRASFDFTPPAPENGKLKGVVELGASGFNSFIVDVDRQKNWALKKADYGNSLVYDGLASGEDITVGLKKYISDLLDFGVGANDIHFVVSSGAQKVGSTQQIIDGLKKIGYVVNRVTPEQEGTYALEAAIPRAFRDRAFLLDIGSGNTKVSWEFGDEVIAKETFGSKYYQDNVDADNVLQQAKNIGNQIPGKVNGTCFMLGGVAFNLAKDIRQDEERYTVLNAPADYSPDDAKTKAGINILSGILEGSGCETVIFDWDANFTIGFLLGLPY